LISRDIRNPVALTSTVAPKKNHSVMALLFFAKQPACDFLGTLKHPAGQKR
jgi:hypothetical protein